MAQRLAGGRSAAAGGTAGAVRGVSLSARERWQASQEALTSRQSAPEDATREASARASSEASCWLDAPSQVMERALTPLLKLESWILREALRSHELLRLRESLRSLGSHADIRIKRSPSRPVLWRMAWSRSPPQTDVKSATSYW